MSATHLPSLFFASCAAGCAALGVWQVKRYSWKDELIKDLENSYKAGPKRVTRKDVEIDGLESFKNQKVLVKGKFFHGHDVLLGLRSCPSAGNKRAAQGLATNPQGYYVLSPFRVNDSEAVVFVNRGWIPMQESCWKTPKEEVELEGIIASGEKPSAFSPTNDPNSRLLLWLDAFQLPFSAQLMRRLGNDIIEDFPIVGGKDGVVIIDVLDEKSNDNFAVECMNHLGISNKSQKIQENREKSPVQPIPKSIDLAILSHYVTPETHAAYAFTWIALSLFSVALAVKLRKVPSSVVNAAKQSVD